jgi:hypothetical protein
VVELVIVGDFNRHDQLWGGDDVSLGRQGEADPIIDLMNEFAPSGLLKRGTKTWQGGGLDGDCESTIDLVSWPLRIWQTPWSSVQYMGQSTARTTAQLRPCSIPRGQFQNIRRTLAAIPSVQQKTDRLTSAV